VLAITVLVLWVMTAAAGVALLSTGNAARRLAAGPVRTASGPARSAAVPLTDDGKPPPVPRTRVTVPPGEHPLLEFSHPALALAGLAFWFVFVLIHYRPLAWISFGILVVTLGAGLGWLAANALATRRRQDAARAFPPRLIVLHGLAGSVAIALTVLTALSASHA
jgi:predicted alpha/beta-fold hydrolase